MTVSGTGSHAVTPMGHSQSLKKMPQRPAMISSRVSLEEDDNYGDRTHDAIKHLEAQEKYNIDVLLKD